MGARLLVRACARQRVDWQCRRTPQLSSGQLHFKCPSVARVICALSQVELMEVVDFFRKPELFRASGSRIPRGVLLCGPPGTGKTLLAR